MSIHALRTLIQVSVLVTSTLLVRGQTGNTRAFAASVSHYSDALIVRAAIVVQSESTLRDVATAGEAGNFFANATVVPRGALRSQPRNIFGGRRLHPKRKRRIPGTTTFSGIPLMCSPLRG